MPQQVNVIVVVEIDGESKEFSTAATTTAEPTRVAAGLLDGLDETARVWLRDKRTGGNSA